jgi:hypothetical protein
VVLSEKERALTEIALATVAATVSAARHLRILEFSKLVELRREQNLVYYHIAENEKTRNCLVFRNRPKELWMDSNPI